MLGLWFFCVSVCVPTAAFQCKSTGGNDFFGFFPAFGTGNCFGAHFDKFFGHRTVLAFELVHWHVFHPNMLIYDLYSNDFLPVVNTSISSFTDKNNIYRRHTQTNADSLFFFFDRSVFAKASPRQALSKKTLIAIAIPHGSIPIFMIILHLNWFYRWYLYSPKGLIIFFGQVVRRNVCECLR